jgi:hypothetical protein
VQGPDFDDLKYLKMTEKMQENDLNVKKNYLKIYHVLENLLIVLKCIFNLD